MTKRATARKRPGGAPRRRSGSGPGNALVTRDELAQAMGVNAYTITKWQLDGLPIVSRGRAGVPSRYDQAACLAWKAARDVSAATAGGLSVATENAKLKRAQTEGQELRNRRLRGELLEAGDVERTWAGFVAAARAKLLALPHALAERACQEAAQGRAAVEALLREDMHAVLRELAGDSPSPAVQTPALAEASA